MSEVAAALKDVRGKAYFVRAGTASRALPGVEPLWELVSAEFPDWVLVFGRTSKFTGALASHSNDPLIKWPDPAVGRQRRLAEPPERFVAPFWIMFTASPGAARNATTVRGAVAASVARIDHSNWIYTLQLHARSLDVFQEPPLGLADPDQIRDYWFKAAAKVYGVTL